MCNSNDGGWCGVFGEAGDVENINNKNFLNIL